VEIGYDQGNQGKSDDKVSGGEITWSDLHPHLHVQTESGSSRERREVERSQGQDWLYVKMSFCSTSNPITADETQRDRKLTASVETRLILRGVKESPNVYPPLKSVAEGLCFVLDNWEIWSPSVRSIHNAYGRSSEQK